MKSATSHLYIIVAALLNLPVAAAIAANCPSSDARVSSIANCTVVGSASAILINFNSGFDDATAIAPIDGNNGETVGEQRRLAYIKAAEVLAEQIVSSQTIEVDGQFNNLECDTNSAVLGSAGAAASIAFEVSDNIDGVLLDTFYPIGLANHLYGEDIDPSIADIEAEFNAKLGQTGCLDGAGWYYGYGQAPGFDTSFLPVLLHEMIHGLGFSSLVNPSNGTKPSGLDDVFSNNLYVPSLEDTWNNLNDTQRAQSATSVDDLYWAGQQANSQAIGQLTNGFYDGDESGGSQFTFGDFIQMYAPSPLEQGSSVSHFDTSASPNELMEPNLTISSIDDIGLALCLLKDIGWGIKKSDDGFYLNVFCQSLSNGETYTGIDSETLHIDFVSDSSNYTYELQFAGNSVADLITETDRGIAIGIPTTGAFAGEYTLTVSNGTDPDITVTITRPLGVQWSAEALLSGENYELTITGGAPNSVFDLTTDPGNALIFTDANGNTITNVTATNSAAEFNPAEVNVKPTSVLTITDVDAVVVSQSNAYPSRENTISVYPALEHDIRIIDTNGHAIGDVDIEITNYFLTDILALETRYTTDVQGSLALNLSATNHTATLLVTKTGYDDQYWYLNNTETQHEITLIASNAVAPEEEEQEEVTESGSSSKSSRGFGALSFWVWLLLAGIVVVRKPTDG